MKLSVFRHKTRLKFFYQLESVDCGPACLAMVAAHYKKKYSVKDVKEFCAVTRMGVSVQDIITGGRKMGFESSGVKLTLPELEEAPLPMILFWKQDHFVVLYEVVRTKKGVAYFLADPGYGKIKLDEETVTKEWMGNNPKGVAILMQPSTEDIASHVPGKRVKLYKEELVKFILRFTATHKMKYALSFLLLIMGLVTNWAIPLVFRQTIDRGIVGKSLHIVWILLLAQLALFLGNFVSQLVSNFMLAKINFRLSILMKENLLYKLLRLPISYFDTRMNSDTLQRLSDQSKIQTFVTWRGLDLFMNCINIIAFSIILLTINKYVFIIFFVLSLISVIWVAFFLRLRKILEYALFLRQSENSNSLYEFIMNMPEIKINSAQRTMIGKLIKIQEKLNVLELRSLFLNMYQIIGVTFISKLKELIAIALCAWLIIKGEMTIGTLVSISYILGQLAAPIQNFVNYLRDMQDADIARRRISDVYSEKEENDDSKGPVPALVRNISVENIAFKYPGTFSPFVLKDVSFDIPRNKVTAIVGVSGSGKTTLLKLLLAYYDPTEGCILINRSKLSGLHSEDWRKSCGTVLQDGHIFAGTIAENIAIADAVIDRQKLSHAARVACLHDFIEGLPMGYNTKVGSVGVQLSGGQKQRMLIARAVYKNPEFLFFDEATSSLDANNERQIMENLQEFFTGKTVVIIAHRLSTVKNADQIIVLDKGVIVERGTHHSLVHDKGEYFELVRNQLELGV